MTKTPPTQFPLSFDAPWGSYPNINSFRSLIEQCCDQLTGSERVAEAFITTKAAARRINAPFKDNQAVIAHLKAFEHWEDKP